MAQVMRWLSKHGMSVEHLSATLLAKDPPDEALETFKTGFVGILAQLPRLKTLAFRAGEGFMIPQQDLYCLANFPKLESLRLNATSVGTWDATTSEPLSCLTALSSLDLTISGLRSQPLVLSPKLSKLTALKSLSLSRQGKAHTINVGHLVSVITSLSGLQQLELSDMLAFLPADLARLPQLQRLTHGLFQHDGPVWSMAASFITCRHLTHVCLGQLPSEASRWWWGVCNSLQALPHLRSLCLHRTDLSDAASDAWAFSSQLSCLDILDCELDRLPPALCSLTTLAELRLAGNLLHEIPGGPYLERLVCLDLSGNWLRCLPIVLGQAKRLRKFVVGQELHEEEWWEEEKVQAILPAGCSISHQGMFDAV